MRSQRIKIAVTWISAASLLMMSSSQLDARGGGGGRGGGGFGGGGSHGGGGGGGGARPGGGNRPGGGGGSGGGGGNFGGGGRSSNHTGSFSSPSPGNFQASRPSYGSRPSSAGNRPGGGEFFSPSATAKAPGFQGGGVRPGSGNRPGGGDDRPGAGGNRPGGGDRPGGVGNLPGGGNRPGGGDDRPGAGGNRPGGGDRPGGAGNRPLDGNRPGNNNFNHIGNTNINSFSHNHIDHGDWHHGNWHDHWDHHWNNWPAGWGNWGWGYGAGFATGAIAASIPWGWGYSSYSNPYYVESDGGYDYSQPIMASGQPTSDQAADTSQPTAADQASQQFDAARAAFKQGDYQTALSQVDQAIAKMPDDTNLHEFRGLALFALGKYKDAAAAIYGVLSAGPGWDWTTLAGLYSDADIYTQQLRALEAYCRKNPSVAEARFLLAYEYLTCGQTDAAADEFKQAVKLNPKDTLSAQMVATLAPPKDQPQPQPDQPAAPPKPVSAASLAGNWTATRPDGATIGLNLGKDSKFTWKFDDQGKSKDFSGTYSVADNLLILNQNESPMMVGQVSLADRAFNFKLTGNPPSDPGLTFKR